VTAQCLAENSKGGWVFKVFGTVQVKNEYGDWNITCKSSFMPQFKASLPTVHF